MDGSILLIEDDDGDIELVTTALATSGSEHGLVIARNATEAFAAVTDAGRSPPALVMLDLNLPGGDGHSVLRRLKDDATTRRIPVVVLSGSTSPVDIERALTGHANAYVVKPDEFDTLVAKMSAIIELWLGSGVGNTRPQLSPPRHRAG